MSRGVQRGGSSFVVGGGAGGKCSKHFHPLPPFLVFSFHRVASVTESMRSWGGAIKAGDGCFQTSNPGAPACPLARLSVSPNHGISAAESLTLEEKYLICPLWKDQQPLKRRGPCCRGGVHLPYRNMRSLFNLKKKHKSVKKQSRMQLKMTHKKHFYGII